MLPLTVIRLPLLQAWGIQQLEPCRRARLSLINLLVLHRPVPDFRHHTVKENVFVKIAVIR